MLTFGVKKGANSEEIGLYLIKKPNEDHFELYDIGFTDQKKNRDDQNRQRKEFEQLKNEAANLYNKTYRNVPLTHEMIS